MEHDRLPSSPLTLGGDGPFINPLFGDGATPRRTAFTPQTNPVWSPQVPGDTDLAMVPALPPPPSSYLSLANEPSGAAMNAGEEGAFADVIAELMQQRIDSAQAVRSFADICQNSASLLREQAGLQQQRAARALRLKEQAASLEAEAATWQLLWHLYGTEDSTFPAGTGRPLAAEKLTVSQRIAAVLADNQQLNWLARVVAWLEALAADALDRSEAAAVRAGGSGMRFARGEGLPLETRLRLDQRLPNRVSDADALVSHLDPDAPTREGKRWADSNVKDEERLMKHLFRLLRCGRLEAARQLCDEVGQPWRAVSVGGSNGFGLVPLGASAELADARSPLDIDEDLASETELGSGTLRALWRWACYQASERIGQQPSGQHEAALYGALSSNISRVLPLSNSWEDAVWALTRSWLEAEVDRQLTVPAVDDGISLEVLLAAAGADVSGAGAEVIGEGLSVGQGQWPLDKLMKALPQTLDDVFDAATRYAPSAASGRREAADVAAQQRYVQTQLIRGRGLLSHLLVDHLPSLVKPEEDDLAEVAPPRCLPDTLRFAAHLGLSLSHLGLIPSPHDSSASLLYRSMQDSVNDLLQLYMMHLIDTGQHSLLPLYACHLRANVRHEVYGLLISLLTGAGSMDACVAAFEEGSNWFAAWAEAGNGDVQPTEMAIIVEQAAEKSRWAVSGGPLLRAQAACWLWFSPATLPAALAHANQLMREFALGAGGGGAAAAHALLDLLPHEIRTHLDQGNVLAIDAYGEELAVPLAELRAWNIYFRTDRQYRRWAELYAHLVTDRPLPPSAEDKVQLRESGLHALQSLLAIVSGHLLMYVAPSTEGPQSFTLFVGEDAGVDASADVASGLAYPALLPEEAAALAANLNAGFAEALLSAAGQTAPKLQGLRAQARSAAQQPLPDGRVGAPLEGALQIDATCTLAEGSRALATLLSEAIKGVLSGVPQALQVLNMVGPDSVQAALCHRVCYPRLLLRCAALREALIGLGEAAETGQEVIDLVAGNSGLSDCFSPAELQQLLELERRALLAAKVKQ